ncbi:MAG: hypothetical protein NTV55_11840 [Planctomycetota bacterium]|nr:hypothetical protein [Planctomycetota bacterium]
MDEANGLKSSLADKRSFPSWFLGDSRTRSWTTGDDWARHSEWQQDITISKQATLGKNRVHSSNVMAMLSLLSGLKGDDSLLLAVAIYHFNRVRNCHATGSMVKIPSGGRCRHVTLIHQKFYHAGRIGANLLFFYDFRHP